ncbi:hypothetical protein NQ318_008069 [Aromia moschata]|uniref:DDE Tnp4 domain-containing protein n=1 Tax=Aromia moschata TaxID=1265417 RepID=A0AAV8YMZ8_9CUCU|nr:hypothetical protein NQ318_008069 [Aromia moschata]
MSITCHERLTVTLRFLATSRSYEDLKYSTIISPQSMCYLIAEICKAIYNILNIEYIQLPSWALNKIIPPSGTGSYFYNYKGKHSMVLMAIANVNYEFIMCDFGTNGRISEGGVLENTKK